MSSCQELNPKFEYFTQADQKDKVLSVKKMHALHAEYRGAIAWAEFDDAVEAHYKCALMACCKTYPKGGFEPFPFKGIACINDRSNTDVIFAHQKRMSQGLFCVSRRGQR